MISAINRCSLVDYPGQVAVVLYTQGCNMNCVYCHNRTLIPRISDSPEAPWRAALEETKGKAGAVVITGGEPTLHDLCPIISFAHQLGYLVKVDTNGTSPRSLLLALFLSHVNYVAVDIKYRHFTFSTGNQFVSLQHARDFTDDFEARTTVDTSLCSVDELKHIADDLIYHVGRCKWFLQNANSTSTFTAHPFPYDKLSDVVVYAKRIGIDASIR